MSQLILRTQLLHQWVRRDRRTILDFNRVSDNWEASWEEVLDGCASHLKSLIWASYVRFVRPRAGRNEPNLIEVK